MDSRVAAEVSISDLFEQFIDASTMRNVLSIHHRILNYADLDPCEFNDFFPRLKRAVLTSKQKKNWKAKALFSKIDKRAAQKCYSNSKVTTHLISRSSDNQQVDRATSVTDDSYSSPPHHTNNNALQNYNCLVIGSGPAGLRTAIELQLLGASKVTIVEKRSRFSRNNVLHLWPFVIDDLKSLGGKKFYGKFCAGSIDHISIRQLQLMLLKVCLMIGCDFRDSCSYMSLCPASIKQHPSAETSFVNSGDHDGSLNHDSSSINSKSTMDEKCEVYKSDPIESEYSRVPVGQQEDETNQSDSKPYDDANSKQSSSRMTLKDTSIDKTSDTKHNSEQEHSRSLKLHGVHAHFECETKLSERLLHDQEWNFIIGADGRRNTLSKFFPRKEFRGRLAIAITANFINRQTTLETSVPEISGLSFIYNQDMFNALACDTNIQLENICYYKDDTHYFVMTAKKKSLLERGVLVNDFATTQDLLSESNINREALLKYAKDAAYWTTGLEPLDFALNHYGQEDCAMFDFTSMYAASNACKAIRTKNGGLTLVGLVGDSLLEPFWPTGSGCARGFLSSLDAAWMCRQWAVNRCAVIDYHQTTSSRSSKTLCISTGDREEPTTYNRMALSVMAERESIYRILAQTTSENLQQNYSHWTLNPHTRYPNLNRHLVLPLQVEHLITDNEVKGKIEGKSGRRSKSPNALSSRKAPKKLKSANASPITEPKNSKNHRSKSLSRHAFKSKSKHDLTLDDTYLKFEESYKNLVEDERNGMTQYLNHRQPDCDAFEDLFKPSLSGTLPSSNNLLNLEAGRARDIDECLRQRRQKTKINFVRDQLICQLRGDSFDRDSPLKSNGGNVALFNELKRLREQRAKGTTARPTESKSRECGPLTLLASMRRCASFAERVKSFENKLSISEPQTASSPVTTPKTPIDNVKNLPQFATLQELFVNNSAPTSDKIKKSKIPITKLSKDDWNVKCWEKRLASAKLKNDSRSLGGSVKNLTKTMSVDTYRSHLPTPKKQVEVFQDRIKDMAQKLKTSKDVDSQTQSGNQENVKIATKSNELPNGSENGVRSQGWINHLKRELVKGVEAKSSPSRQPMNPIVPNKPIKKLFDDDDDDDDGIDINKHYDHLCINRPTNKYLTKGAYTSHLTRTRLDSSNSKVINRPKISAAESKQMYLAASSIVTSRGSSTSSARSDYSTNSSSLSNIGEMAQKQPNTIIDVECSRCCSFVSKAERITIGDSTLHRNCLSCSSCGITLRSNEIQHHLNELKRLKMMNNQKIVNDESVRNESRFTCTICKPNIRSALNVVAANRSNEGEQQQDGGHCKVGFQNRLQSREKFFSSRVDYGQLYKNIWNPSSTINDEKNTDNKQAPDVDRNNAGPPEDMEPSEVLGLQRYVSPSPIQVTIPLKMISDEMTADDHGESRKQPNVSSIQKASEYRVARSETIDGSEQVTLVLPGFGDGARAASNELQLENNASKNRREMIDEDELQRILHLDKNLSQSNEQNSPDEDENDDELSSSSDHLVITTNKDSDNECDNFNGDIERQRSSRLASIDLSDGSSSLNSPPSEVDGDENTDDDDIEQNSTYDDLVTSEEFDTATSSDKDNEDEQEEDDVDVSQRSRVNDGTECRQAPLNTGEQTAIKKALKIFH